MSHTESYFIEGVLSCVVSDCPEIFLVGHTSQPHVQVFVIALVEVEADDDTLVLVPGRLRQSWRADDDSLA